MHGGLFGRRRRAVDADVDADEVLLGVLAETLVGVDETTGPAAADLADDGVAAVTLVEGETDVYGPMSLAEG